MALHTQADMRDDIRRLMAIVPPVDSTTSPGAVGTLPSWQPDPPNSVINSAIQQAISAINRYVRVGPFQDFSDTVSAAPTFKRGTYFVDVRSFLPPGGSAGALGGFVFHANEHLDVTWTDSKGTVNRLEPYTYYSGGKGYAQFQQYSPGTPEQYTLGGYQIGLLPPPAESGTLTFTVASGMNLLEEDTDTILYLPDDFVWVINYWAVMLLSARDALDVEAQTRFQQFAPLAMQGIVDIYVWRNGYDQKGVQSLQATLQMVPQMIQQQRLAVAVGDNS